MFTYMHPCMYVYIYIWDLGFGVVSWEYEEFAYIHIGFRV